MSIEDCKICGGYRERTGNMVDISKHIGYRICKVEEYICLECGAKSVNDGMDISHFA